MVVLKAMSVLTTNLALLHAGGWDEILFVAVGLVVAWAIIAWTGRSRGDEDDEEEGEDPDATALDEADRDSGSGAPRRARERRDDE